MELRRQHMYVSICVFIFMMEMCRTETIDVTFSTTALNEFTYTLDVDHYDREYNCSVPDDNTEKEWSYALSPYSNPINIYDLYKNGKSTGTYSLVCIRKGVTTNSYVGPMDVEIIEGGHISVEGSGRINREYTSNTALNVTQNTANFILTCSARTGEWILPNGDTSLSFPVITIPSVTSQHSGTYSCRRVLANMVVLSVELDLTVIPEKIVGGVGELDPSETVPSLTSTSSVISSTSVTESMTSSTSISIPTSISTSVPTSIPTSIPTSVPTSIPTSIPTSVPTSVPTFIPTSIPTSVPTSFPTSVPTFIPTSIPTSIPSSISISIFSSESIPSSSLQQEQSSSSTVQDPILSSTPTPIVSTPVVSTPSFSSSPVVTPLPSSYPPTPTPTPSLSTSVVVSAPGSSSVPATDTSTPHTSTPPIPTPTPSELSSIPVTTSSTAADTISSSLSESAATSEGTIVPSSSASVSSSYSFPSSTPLPSSAPLPALNTSLLIPVLMGLAAVIILAVIVVVVVVWCLCVTCIRKRGSRKYTKTSLTDEEITPVASKTKSPVRVPVPPPYQPVRTPEPDSAGGIFSGEIAQEDFKARVELLWQKENNLLIEEYNALGGSEYRYATDKATNPAVKAKNRYRNILPYNRSRVVLDSIPDQPTSDYINASLIPGVYVKQEFVSSQGPNKETVEDMWRMLWQEKICTVVMLTRVVEGQKRKCEQYWPERVGDGERYGSLFVTLVGLQQDKLWVCREMTVSDNAGTEKLLIRHFQFVVWPDFDAPRFPQDLIRFLQKVQLEAVKSPSPLCVHCSAGVGRSGAFITLFNLSAAISAGRGISVFNVVNEIREHRPMMVQAFPQYKFIYLAVLELLQGDTSVPAINFPIFYQSRCEMESDVFELQFAELEFQTEKAYTRANIRALDALAINPCEMVLPYDDCGVELFGQHWNGSSYINASYVEDYYGDSSFIATQLPVSESVRDLMQLIYQTEAPLVLLLASRQEFEEMKYDEGLIRYWPDPMMMHEFDGFNLMNENQLQHPFINKMKLVCEADESEVEFKLITLLDWTEGGHFKVSPDSMQRLTAVVQEMDQCLRQKKCKVILQCTDGAGASGVMISAYNSICQLKEEQSVDVFQSIKRMRYCRPSMVNSLDQYISVHSIINSYLHGTSYDDPPTPTEGTYPFISSL